jgi:hypothetical protein
MATTSGPWKKNWKSWRMATGMGFAVYRTNGLKGVFFARILAKTRNNLILLICTSKSVIFDLE